MAGGPSDCAWVPLPATPPCAEGCPSTYEGDGVCDPACNNAECNYDAGSSGGASDCAGLGGGSQFGSEIGSNHGQCAPGCYPLWVRAGARDATRVCHGAVR